MKRTENNLLELYTDITAYAASKLRQFGLPRCDLPDIIGEAYQKAQAKLPRSKARKDRASLLKNIAWSEVIDELRRRNRLADFANRHSVRLDAPRSSEDNGDGDDELENDGLIISDEGAGAAAIRYHDEGDTPEWVYGVRLQYERERGLPRKVLDQLKYFWDYREVRRNLGLGGGAFYKIMKKLRMRFDQCFQAYHTYLAENAMRIS